MENTKKDKNISKNKYKQIFFKVQTNCLKICQRKQGWQTECDKAEVEAVGQEDLTTCIENFMFRSQN